MSNFIPAKCEQYIPFGEYETLKQIVSSRVFYPLWVSGNTGNGKTKMIEQVCAACGRELIRVNFTKETDEGQLIGHYTLINGDTVFQHGPIIEAMKRGAILLLDEIDLGEVNKISVLHPVLENGYVYIKQTGERIMPEHGFNIFATANTKGRGSDNGRFIGTSIMNAAFIDRFSGMIEHSYPDEDTEYKILQQYFVTYCWKDRDPSDKEMIDAKDFIMTLCKWAKYIRDTFNNSGTDEVISTRTLIAIIQGYAMFKERTKAISMACEKFDPVIKDDFLKFYQKVLG